MDDVCEHFAKIEFLINLDDAVPSKTKDCSQLSFWGKLMSPMPAKARNVAAAMKKGWNPFDEFIKMDNGVIIFQFHDGVDA